MANMKYVAFSFILQKYFIFDKERAIDEVGPDAHIPPSTLYKRVQGETIMPAEEIRQITKATKSPIFLEFIAEGTPFMIMPRPEAIEQKGLSSEMMDVPPAVGKLFEDIQKDQPSYEVLKKFDALQREVEEMKIAYKKDHKL